MESQAIGTSTLYAYYMRKLYTQASLYYISFTKPNHWSDQIYTVKKVLEDRSKYNADVQLSFVEYTILPTLVFYKVMLDFGIPQKLVRMIRVKVMNTTALIKV